MSATTTPLTQATPTPEASAPPPLRAYLSHKWRTDKRFVAGCCVVGLVLLGVLGSAHRGGATPGASTTGMTTDAAPQTGVHVCAPAHYDRPNVRCRQDDAVLTEATVGEARVVYQASAGFSKDTVIVRFDQLNADGSETMLGQTMDNGDLGNAAASLNLRGAMDQAGAFYAAGRYRVTVGYSDAANGMDQLLGDTTFTIK